MYEFNDMKINQASGTFIPSEAITFNNVLLDTQIGGYQTLSVSGRDNLSQTILTDPVDGMDGLMYRGKKINEKAITVRYMIKSNSPEELIQIMDELKYYLRHEEAYFSFEDEKDFEYIGTVSEIIGIPEGHLTGVGTFTLLLSKPFKFKKAERITSSVPNVVRYPVIPVEIIVIRNASGNSIRICNTTQDLEIGLSGSFDANTPIFIYPKDSTIKRNNVERAEWLEWTSDLENFFLHAGDSISITPTGATLEITFRRAHR